MKKILLANKFFFLNGGSEKVLFQERDFFLDQGFQIADFSMADHRNLPSPYSEFFVSKIDYHCSMGIWSKIDQARKLIHSQESVKELGID